MYQDMPFNSILLRIEGEKEPQFKLSNMIPNQYDPNFDNTMNSSSTNSLIRQISELNSLIKHQKIQLKNQQQIIKRLQAANSRRAVLPKHTTPAYFYYVQHRHPQLVQSNPSLTFGQAGRLLGEEWRNMTELEKQPYLQQSAADKARYSDEVSHVRNLTFSGRKTDKKKKVKKNRYNSALPKRSQSAYLYFAQKRRPEIQKENPDYKFSSISAMLGKEWKGA
jgi:hypothetical protein